MRSVSLNKRNAMQFSVLLNNRLSPRSENNKEIDTDLKWILFSTVKQATILYQCLIKDWVILDTRKVVSK